MVDGLDKVVFDIDNKIGLDTKVDKERAKKEAKDNKTEMDRLPDSDDPDYEITRDNILGRTHVDKMEMPKKQHP